MKGRHHAFVWDGHVREDKNLKCGLHDLSYKHLWISQFNYPNS